MIRRSLNCATLSALVVVVYWLFAQIPQALGASPNATIQDIIRAWQHREERTRSLVFEWQETELWAKGSRNFQKVHGNPMVITPVFYPPKDMSWGYDRRLKLDGEKIRYELEGPMAAPQLGRFVPRRNLRVSDGQVTKVLYDAVKSGHESQHATGFVRNSANLVAPHLIQLRTILLCYRSFAVDMGENYDLSQYAVRPTSATIGEHGCVVLTGPMGGVKKNVIWIDVEREYVPLRWQSIVEGEMRIQLDMDYQPDASHGWVPSGWKYHVYAQPEPRQSVGKLKQQGTARVTSYEVNSPIPSSEFRFEFPVGTYVSDRRNDSVHIVKAGGQKRIVTDQERTADYSYERLATTESGKAAGRGTNSATDVKVKWAWALGTIGVMAVIVLVLLIRIRRKAAIWRRFPSADDSDGYMF